MFFFSFLLLNRWSLQINNYALAGPSLVLFFFIFFKTIIILFNIRFARGGAPVETRDHTFDAVIVRQNASPLRSSYSINSHRYNCLRGYTRVSSFP